MRSKNSTEIDANGKRRMEKEQVFEFNSFVVLNNYNFPGEFHVARCLCMIAWTKAQTDENNFDAAMRIQIAKC